MSTGKLEKSSTTDIRILGMSMELGNMRKVIPEKIPKTDQLTRLQSLINHMRDEEDGTEVLLSIEGEKIKLECVEIEPEKGATTLSE